MSKVSYEVFKELLPKNMRRVVTEETVEEINKLVEDPDYGEEFKSSVLTATGILGGKESWSLRAYVDAVKYYSLTAMTVTQADAYCRVFPDRLQSRLDRGETKNDMNGEASRYNGSDLVNRIRLQAQVPLHLVNQGNVQLAINVLVDIAVGGRSEIARVSAATSLLKELRPPETQKIEMAIGLSDEAVQARERQTEALLEIAQNQQRLLKEGVSIAEIQKMHITKKEYIDIDIED